MINRRKFIETLAATGVGSVTLHRALFALAQDEEAITAEMIQQAEWICGMELTEDQREALAKSVNDAQESMDNLRKVPLDFADLPATHFEPLRSMPTQDVRLERNVAMTEGRAPRLPESEDAIAFLPVTELASLIRSGLITSTDLTKLYLKRLKKYSPMLLCTVNLTEELALEQARRADAEIAAGRYRGPLHGVPWGAKDLMAVRGYPTTWGMPQFRDRVIDETATVARRLEQAGAVLVAKLSLGAIAMGDRWFEGMTRSPWNPRIGSSGSSAGSAAATVAGLVGFSIGTETLGSIVSPCRRCGANGLRPTFGRVSRHGCMPLSWTMDKVGPITRSVEDCALVFAAIHGADGHDPTAADFPFEWPPRINPSRLRVGYVKQKADENINDREDLAPLRDLGVDLVAVSLPENTGARAMANIIDVEGASVFEQMLLANDTEGWNAWPGIFRYGKTVTAVDYLRFQRVRRQLMKEMEALMSTIDVLFNAFDLFITNLTGHPSVVLPTGFRERRGFSTPRSVVLTGGLNDESRLLALAHAYQQKQVAHLKHPDMDGMLKKYEAGEFEPNRERDSESSQRAAPRSQKKK